MRGRYCQKHRRLTCLTLAMLAFAGCNSEIPFTPVPVSGKLTLDDGSPIKAHYVNVHFDPQNFAPIGQHYPRAAHTVLLNDGRFTDATTFVRGDGVIPGTHRVVVEASNSDLTPCIGAVPSEFTDLAATPLQVVVRTDAENHFELTVRSAPNRRGAHE